jgi:hypothetical protein
MGDDGLVRLANLPGVAPLINWSVRWALRRRLGRRSALILSRPELDRAYPIEKLLRDDQEIHACWLTGIGVFAQNVKFSSIKRLMLPHPQTEYLAKLEESLKVTGRPYYRFDSDIRGVTEQARGLGIKTRWFQGFSGLTMTIGNPLGNDAWVHVEMVLPFVEPNERTVIRIEKRKHEKAFSEMWTAYERMWEDAGDPNKPVRIETIDSEFVKKKLLTLGFSPTLLEGQIEQCVWRLKSHGLFDQTKAAAFFQDDDVRNWLKDVYARPEYLGRADAPLDPIGYCIWGPTIQRSRGIEQQTAKELVVEEIRKRRSSGSQ